MRFSVQRSRIFFVPRPVPVARNPSKEPYVHDVTTSDDSP